MGTQEPFATQHFTDTQTSESTVAPEPLNISYSPRYSFFNPIQPGSAGTESPSQDTALTSRRRNDPANQELITQHRDSGIKNLIPEDQLPHVAETHSVAKQLLRTKGPINIANVEATQRAMLERKRRAGKKGKLAQPPSSGDSPDKGSAEDYSWMDEAPDHDEYEDLIGRVATLQQRQNNGKITQADMVKLNGLKKKLLSQKRLRDAAATAEGHEEEEPSLFVPEETIEEAARRHVRSAPEIFRKGSCVQYIKEEETEGDDDALLKAPVTNAMDVDGENASPSATEAGDSATPENEPKKTKKPRRKATMNAREYHERERQDRQNKELQKAQKKKARNPLGAPRKDSKKTAAKITKKRKGAVKVNKKMEKMLNTMGVHAIDGQDDITKMFLDEFISGDQMADRLTNPIFNVAPGKKIFTKRKDTQFQKLLEDLPDGSNKKYATSDKEKLRRAALSFGSRMVKAVNGRWLVKGMKSPLLHHQLLGAQWMLSREFGDGQGPFGGLLADTMGLGKTVQTLACMVGNLPQEEDRKRGRGATLIVAPTSVIDQWMEEIYVHTQESVFPKIYHYSSKSKMSRAIIESLDIVVTSYTEVMRQFPWPDDKTEKRLIKSIGFDNWLKQVYDEAGVLHQISWYRVVLDEAHAIKNDSARTSVACQNLRSLYKWCLTGTPLMNRLEE